MKLKGSERVMNPRGKVVSCLSRRGLHCPPEQLPTRETVSQLPKQEESSRAPTSGKSVSVPVDRTQAQTISRNQIVSLNSVVCSTVGPVLSWRLRNNKQERNRKEEEEFILKEE